MSYEDRKKASLGINRMFYCPFCMIEQEVYSARGHKENQMNLHCVECTKFVTRLIKDFQGNWELDWSIYDKGVKP